MKITALILAAALPFAANADQGVDTELQQRRTALIAFDDLEKDDFRSKHCWGQFKRIATRGALGLHPKEFRIAQMVLPQAKAAAACDSGTHGILLFGDEVAEGRLTCRKVLWLSWSGYEREEYTCKPTE